MSGAPGGAALRSGLRVRVGERPRAPAAPRPQRRYPPQTEFPELDSVRSGLAPPIVAWAEWRASSLGVGADRILIAEGFLHEEDYLQAFAAANGIQIEPLTDVARPACPLSDGGLLSAITHGILPLRIGNEIVYVVAPRGTGARRLARLVAWRPDLRRRIRLTSAARFHRFVVMQTGAALGTYAAETLKTTTPVLSAATAIANRGWTGWPPLLALLVSALCFYPEAARLVLDLGFSALFLSWMTLRLLAPLVRRPAITEPRRIAEAELPVYTVMAALYREARSVPALVAALKQLDWPAEKLEVKLIVEPDDRETQAAIAALDLDARFEVIVAPAGDPRTKPKALNAALPFARGTFTVVYDAEDRPEPGQLRAALEAFRMNDDTLACVQAALTIDNTRDSWLARMFTAEYAAHFDVLLPCLAALRLPLPLGGSSNHFRGIRQQTHLAVYETSLT